MTLIISKSNPKRFQRHYNRTLGKFYGSEREYYSDLKKQGLEPYNPDSIPKREKKPYKLSKKAEQMVRTKLTTGKTSDAMRDFMQLPSHYRKNIDPSKLNPNEGGFTDG